LLDPGGGGLKNHVTAVVAFDGINPFHLSVPCLVFGESVPGVPAVEVIVCAAEKGPLRTSAGFTIVANYGLESLEKAQTIIVPGWPDPNQMAARPLLDALVASHQRGARLVGLGLGAFVLAEAGLLRGRKATTHWAWARDFALRFPDVLLDVDVLYVDDGNILTSAGSVAGIDCCLDLLRQQYGAEAVNGAARLLVMPPHRQGGQAQFVEQPLPTAARDIRLAELLDWVRANLEMPHSLDSLARKSHMSRRTFTRHFRQLTGATVGDWLTNERLALSQRLLETTSQSIESIADLAGFSSPTLLRHHFGKAFGISPTVWRQTHRGGGALKQLRADIRFFECMDRVNRAIQRADDLDSTMNDVLDVVLSIFCCDRVYLLHPCDPAAASWQVWMERTRPEYPGALALGVDLPMDEGVAGKLRILLNSDHPVQFGPGNEHEVPAGLTERFGIRSLMAVTIYPKQGRPWEFGVHQCSHVRNWAADEERILLEIGRRLADGLTSMLAHHALRESERALRLKERQYRTLAENAPDNIARYDREARFLYGNRRMLRTAGISQAELIGRTGSEVFPAANLAHFDKAVLGVAATGAEASVEVTLPPDGGGPRIHQIHMVAERDGSGDIVSVLAIGRDISENRRLEELVAIREREFRSLAETSPDNIIRYDADCRAIYVNQRFAATVNMVARYGSHLGKTPVEFSPNAPGVYNYQEKLKNVILTGRQDSVEIVVKGADGDAQTHNIIFVAERDARGEIIGAVGFGRDISAIKQAEEQLRIAAIAFEAQEGMVITDADQVILRVNRAFSEITGYAPEDVVGQTPRLLKSGRHDASFYESIWHRIVCDGSWVGEIWNRRRNGEIYLERLNITAVKNDRENVTHYVGTLTDISTRETEKKMRSGRL